MNKKKSEKELIEHNKRLSKENEELKKKLGFVKEKLKIQSDKLENWQTETNFKELKEYKRKYELLLQERQCEKAKHTKEIESLEVSIKNLTDRLNKDSSNSSIPSSAEKIYTKKKCVNTSREKTGRKTGGQIGHKGSGLTKEKAEEMIKSGKEEHVIEEHVLEGTDINERESIVKYEIDIETKTRVIEHRFYVKETAKEIPVEYNTDVQYGVGLKTFAAVALNEGFISLNRTTKIIDEMTNNTIKLSEGSLVNFNRELAMKTMKSINRIKKALIKAGILNVDETGVRVNVDETGVGVNGELNCLHTAVTKYYTYYQIENKRGKDGISNLGILEYYVGILVHDHFSSYYQYKTMTHAECNAHILRYLNQVIEVFEREGAKKFLEFLIKTNTNKRDLQAKNIHEFKKEEIEKLETEYLQLLKEWEKEYKAYTKGKTKTQCLIDEGNLFERLREYREEHLLFIKNFKVPFSNNLAERSLRLIKTKMKVSGCYRGEDNGGNFTTIRSLFETVKKQELNLFESIRKVFNKEDLEFVKA